MDAAAELGGVALDGGVKDLQRTLVPDAAASIRALFEDMSHEFMVKRPVPLL
jgi:hypothetical protein